MRSTKRNVDIIIGRGLITAEAIAAELRRRLVKVLADNRRRLTIDRLLELVRRTLQEFEPLLAKNLANAQLASWIIGADSIAKRLPKHVVKQLAAMNLGLPPNADLPPIIIPPGGTDILQPTRRGDPLIRFPVIDKAVKDLTTRRVVTRPVFDRLSDAFKQESFTIAFLDNPKTIDKMREALTEDIQEGTSLQGFRENVKEKLGASPIGPGHLENVYRTNIQSAFTGGHETIARNPIVKATFPYCRYVAIDDGRVRDEHLALMSLGIDGSNLYRTDDAAFWSLFLPPWSFNCLAPGQLVTTDRGDVPIERVRRGDLVPTHLGNWRHVVGVHTSKGPAELVRIKCHEGTSMRSTAEHRVFTERGWIEAGSLQEGDKIRQYVKSPAVDLVRLKVNQVAQLQRRDDLPVTIAVGPDLISLKFNSNVDTGDIEVEPVWSSWFIELKRDAKLIQAICKSFLSPTHLDYAVDVFAWVCEMIGLPDLSHFAAEFRVQQRTRVLLCGGETLSAIGYPVANQCRFGEPTSFDSMMLPQPAQRTKPNSSDVGDILKRHLLGNVIGKGLCESTLIPLFNRLLSPFSIRGGPVRLLAGHAQSPRYEYVVVRDIQSVPYRGDVYNLSVNGDNSYPVNGLMVSNCRCNRTLMTIRQAAQMGLKEAQRWLKTGEEPPLVSRLPFIPFRPDPAFVGGGRFVA